MNIYLYRASLLQYASILAFSFHFMWLWCGPKKYGFYLSASQFPSKWFDLDYQWPSWLFPKNTLPSRIQRLANVKKNGFFGKSILRKRWLMMRRQQQAELYSETQFRCCTRISVVGIPLCQPLLPSPYIVARIDYTTWYNILFISMYCNKSIFLSYTTCKVYTPSMIV